MISSHFGTLPTGETIEAYTLEGAHGFSAQIITYGATITSLRVPDRLGRLTDVVLGFSDLDSYLQPNGYIGAIVGRVAGRITGAKFSLNGKTYELAWNNPPNHLHGGNVGFDRRVWRAEPVRRPAGEDSLRLTYTSPDGEEGYPGTVKVSVTYTTTRDHALIVETMAETDQPTPFTLAQHSYFNLAGEHSGTIAEHELQILADATATVGKHRTLLGGRENVDARPSDLRYPRRLGDIMSDLYESHGDLYFLPHAGTAPAEPRVVARVHEPTTHRQLTVATTEDCLQFYTGSFLDGTLRGKSGAAYESFAGLCLECQGYPDGANRPELGDIILRPGTPLRHTTVYAFSSR